MDTEFSESLHSTHPFKTWKHITSKKTTLSLEKSASTTEAVSYKRVQLMTNEHVESM